jgi:hypothetical protein
MPRQAQWRGKGHESADKGGRMAGRKPRADQRNSGEGFRPRGGGLRRTKAWEGYIRGRGTLRTNTGALDRAKLAGHRVGAVDHHGRAPAMPKLVEHRAKSGKLGTGKGVSPQGGAQGGLARSLASWMDGEAGVGLRRCGYSAREGGAM